MGSQMKPRHIEICRANPLTDVFRKAEAEQAAAVMILTMGSGPWAEVAPSVMVKTIEAYQNAEPVSLWLRNPVFRPDIDRLIDDGFAEWVGDEVRFTAQGLEALRLSRWNTYTVKDTVAAARFAEKRKSAGRRSQLLGRLRRVRNSLRRKVRWLI